MEIGIDCGTRWRRSAQQTAIEGALRECGIEIDLQRAHAGDGGGLGDGGGSGFDGGQGGVPRLHADYRHQRSSWRVAQRVQTRAYGHGAAAETHRARQEGDAGGAWVEEFQVLGTLPSP